MSFVYTEAKVQMMLGNLNLATSDMRLALVMTNTTADTQEDVATCGAFTTLDEFDGAGYTAGGLALTGEAVNQDAANNRAEFDSNDASFPALGAGSRSIQGALLYKFITNFGASLPVAFVDTGGFPIAANGGDINVVWNLEGILQAT